MTELWNGSAWTEVGDLGTARYGLAGDGTVSHALAFGGTGSATITEDWNGATWIEVADLNTGRRYHGAAGSATSALAVGGNTAAPAMIANAEEWSPGKTTKTVDTD